MRITFTQLLLSMLLVSVTYAHESKAQELLKRRITLTMEDQTIKTVLSSIEQLAEVKFLYSSNVVNSGRKISVSATNEPLGLVLSKVLQPLQLEYQISGKQIVISKKISSLFHRGGERFLTQLPLPDITVTGKVTDERGEMLPGVSVLIKGTNRGTTTDIDGSYTVVVPDARAVLVFSFVGYQSIEEVVGNRTTLSVALQSDTKALEEVVVVGYGTMKKRDMTGAVSQINTNKLQNEAPAQVQDLLRGNAAGLNVGYSASAKGGGSLQIRGRTSFNAGTSPLIVLDGAIYYGQLSDINPNDIETVDVLKDASSAAVFGAKAASGVILVTTKKGKTGKPKINYSTTLGVATMAVNQPVHDAESFVSWRSDVFKSINPNAQAYRFDDPRNLPSNITTDQWLAYDGSSGDPVRVWLRRLNMQPMEIDNYIAGRSVNWYDQVFQNGFRQDHNVSVSGRNDGVSYYLGAGYLNNQGIIVGDQFSTVRTRANIEANITRFLSVGMNTLFSVRDESAVPHSWGQITSLSPWGNEFDQNGMMQFRPNQEVSGGVNPAYDPSFIDRLDKTTTLNSTIFGKVTLPLGITYQINFTPQFEFYERYNHESARHIEWAAFGGRASRRQRKTFYWQVDNIVKWNKEFTDHRFDVTLLANAEKFQRWDNTMTNENFDPNDQLGYHNLSAGINPILSVNDEYSTGDALMSRLLYTFKDRYMFTGTFRRDGYSAFGQSNPRANFGSIALGWVFSDENFIMTSNWFSYGKLRASWGSNGNRDIGRYAAMADLTTGKYLYVRPDGTLIQASQLWVNRMANRSLRWERNTSLNLGLDFGLFNNKIDGTIEVYQMNSTDLLVQRSLPNVIAFDWVMDNLGEVQNRGVELTLNTINMNRDNFSWRTNFNFQLNRNKIVHVYRNYDADGNELSDISNRWFIGKPIDVIWDWKPLGVWQLGQEEEARVYGLSPGDYRLEDVNGDGRLDQNDRQFLGFSEPRFRWSMRNEFQFFKHFDASFMMYSLLGHQSSFNWLKSRNGFPDRMNSYQFPYWTPENPSNEWARINSNEGSTTGFNLYRKRSFVRLDNVSLAYTIPKPVVNKYKIENLRVYLNVRNAAMFSPQWSLWDPEWDPEVGAGPTPRFFTFGVDLTL
ncbi:TonB-dependent receptor [Rhabdobacter roseus]|uniref:TonB-linked SusC/RagA family outer membrane protein n=1 Tax=Rhabdobacter roseus TaxID=1655419 RepID=A0A840TRA9_9BACT|nr:SusC/RagA family TonB-linked outer membrane protein [Rhabdobacter roseus]MBB5286431.1 TonB-linked SusC/RagA family outer membrane protein [Rhabdobacter roseus]